MFLERLTSWASADDCDVVLLGDGEEPELVLDESLASLVVERS